MSENGFFVIDRGVWDHPLFAREKFSEREAWLWLLSSAAWTETRVRIGKAVLDIKRGQLAFATRFLAEKWQWAHSKVIRYINRLRSETMIETLAKREATLITICNYDKYQLSRNAGETQTGTELKREPERQRNKEEESNNKKLNKKLREDSAIAPSLLQVLATTQPILTEGAIIDRDDSQRSYFYENQSIRLNEKDFKRWQEAYSNINLRSELEALANWDKAQGKGWFNAVSGALAKKDREAIDRQKAIAVAVTAGVKPKSESDPNFMPGWGRAR